jgi:hypothetical protein
MLGLIALAAWRPVRAGAVALAIMAVGLWVGALLAASDFPSALWGGHTPPFLSATRPWIQTALIMPMLAWAAWRTRRPGWIAWLLLACFFTQQGAHHVRHLSLTGLMLLPLAAWNLDQWAGAWRRHAAQAAPPSSAARVPVAPAFLLLAALCAYWTFSRREGYSYLERNAMLLRGTQLQPVVAVRPPNQTLPAPTSIPQSGTFLIEPYPANAVNFMLLAGLPAPMWNGGNYAGYLIWRLSPEKYTVFTDNRYDIYGGLFIRAEHTVLNGWEKEDLPSGLPPWREVLDQYDSQTLFLPVEAPVNAKLWADGGWTRVYEDFSFAIWVRNSPQNAAIIEKALSLPAPRPWIEPLPLSR